MAVHAEAIRDVVIVGGGAAGLSAALTLARARRSVTVVDAGEPRNALADGVHGLLGLEGVSPVELLARGRDEVLGYGGEILAGEATDVSCASYGFSVTLRDGAVLHARRLLIATGLVDQLPDIPRVREQWGRGVLHCPYCHGWEVRDRRIGVLGTDPMSVHKAMLFRQWSPDVVFFTHDHHLEPQDRAKLEALDVAVVAGKISRLEIDDDHVTGVRLDDGTVVAVDAVVVSTQMVTRAEPFAGIGIEPTPHPAGAFIETDQFGATSVPGVWAAGNSSDIGAQVGAAAAAGALAGQHINTDLVMKDLDRAVAAAAGAPADEGNHQMEHTFDNDYWDQIWQGDRAQSMGTSQPNQHLVREISDLTPGSALDAGCGAGAEAIWLATRGWQVTGADIAAAALDRAAERAAEAGVAEQVQWVQADLSTWEPDTHYDLVTTHYAHPAMPQLEFYDRTATWVSPHGTLLIVGHLHHDAAADGREHGHAHGLAHDPDGPPGSASATAATITARLDPAEWEVVTAQESHRTMSGPDGHETTLHDVVVKATRRSCPQPFVAASPRTGSDASCSCPPERPHMSSNPPLTAAGPADSTIYDARQRRTVLIAVCVALMAVIASVTGLNVAQPELAVEFDASQSEVLWFINLYTISLAALLLPMGALGDRWGRKPMLLAGLTVFGVSNVAAGLAESSEMMLASRFLSGVGAAMIMPVTLAVITSTFPEEERAKGIGVWTAVAGGGGILGMYLSALLVDVATWRWLFVLPVALVLVSLAMVVRSVPNSRELAAHRFDSVGSATSVLAVIGLIYALHEGPVHGWTEPLTFLALIGGLLAAVAFVAWELRQAAPLLDVRLFGQRGLASGSLTLLVVFGVQAGIFVVLFPFLQAVLGWSALRATLAMMPMALLMMLASVLAPRLAARIGSRSTMATGIFLGGTGLALMAVLVSVDGGFLSVLPGMMAMGLGMGLSMTPSTEAITSSLPRARQGVASALNDVTREFGTALGVALLGAVLTAGYRNSIDSRLDGVPPDLTDTAREGVANAVAAADGPGPQAQALVRAAQESFVDGWQHAMWSGAAVMAVLFIYVLARGPQRAAIVGDRDESDSAAPAVVTG